MVARKRKSHPFAGNNGSILYHRNVPDSAYRKDARIRWIDDRGKVVDSKHAQVARRESRTFHLFKPERAITRLPRQVTNLGRNSGQSLEVCVADHRSDESFVNCYRNSHVNITMSTKSHRRRQSRKN